MSAASTENASSETVRLAIDTVRTLAMDAVQAAESGHPGTPMALAPLAYALYTKHLRHDPAAPDWADRDRFILSVGHASMLLYGTLHLAGYDHEDDADAQRMERREIRVLRGLGFANPYRISPPRSRRA